MDATTRKRLDYLDIFRGFGIVLMVMGHVGFGNTFRHFFNAFHMPMWFFISGYLFFIKGASKQSIAPYVIKKPSLC